MSDNSAKYPDKRVTALFVIATLALMAVSDSFENTGYYFTYVILPTLSVTSWMEYANIKYLTHKKTWLILVASSLSWSLIAITFIFFQSIE